MSLERRRVGESKNVAEEMFGDKSYEAPAIKPDSDDNKGRSRRLRTRPLDDYGSGHMAKARRYASGMLHNPVFGIAIGLVATVAMTFVGIRLSNNVGDPSYAITSQFIFGDYEGLEFTWDGREINNLGAVEIALWNSGNHFIDGSNFVDDVPIVIKEFSKIENVRIISASIKAQTRDSLDFKINVRDGQNSDYVEVVFNKGDALEISDGIRIKLLYTTDSYEDICSCEWSIKSRIKGFPEGFQEQSWSEIPNSLSEEM